MTGTTTATNYARDLNPSIPVHAHWPNGPFLHHAGQPMPLNYILTKTHCGGYCMDCAPDVYVQTQPAFESSCRTGQRYDEQYPETGRSVTYDASIPQKVIHLIRDPFDNLVGRMHLAAKHQLRRNATAGVDFNDGLSGWCSYLDGKYIDEENHHSPALSSLYARYSDLPCRAEWFRYGTK